jgi:hypothetical protein
MRLFKTAKSPDTQSKPNKRHHRQNGKKCDVNRLSHLFAERSRTAAERSEVGWSGLFGFII